MNNCNLDVSTSSLQLPFYLGVRKLRENFSDPLDLLCDGYLWLSLKRPLQKVSCLSLISLWLPTVRNVPEGKLDSGEPADHVVDLAEEPVLVVLSPISSVLLIIVSASIGSRLILLLLAERYAKEDSPRFLGPSVSFPIALPIVLLSVSVVRIRDFLSAHRAVFATALNQLDDAELMENVSALKLTACDHLVLTNSAIFQCIDGLDLFLGARNRLGLPLSVSTLRHKVPDQREVLLEILHEFLELYKLFEVLVQA